MYLDHDSLVEAANQLPPLSNTVSELIRLFRNPDYKVEKVVKVVELDSSLTGMLLRLANSAVYGQPRTANAKTAIMRIGAGMVQAIAFASSVRPETKYDLSMFNLTIESYWHHTLFVTAFAEELATSNVAKFEDEFQMSAVIHDYGKLVMSKTVNDEHKKAMASLDPELPDYQKEFIVLGVNHAEVSAVVCQHWGMPDSLVHTVQFHHDPDQVATPEAYGLNLANHLAWRFAGDPRRNYVVETESRHESIDFFDLSDDQLAEVYNAGRDRCGALLDLFS
ncbi:MAG: HDOD domain-containing protein [Fuerstiella sp.]